MSVLTHRMLRCSSLPVITTCSEPLRRDLLVEDAHDEESSSLGTEAHALYAAMVEGRPPSDQDIDDAAKAADLPAGELKALYAMGAKLWGLVKDKFRGDLHTELEVAFLAQTTDGIWRVPGHVDVAAFNLSAGTFVAGDWKTGRVPRSFLEQFRGYCAGLFHRHAWLNEGAFLHLAVREQKAYVYRFTRAQIQRWIDNRVAPALQSKGYRVSAECEHCPAFSGCPGRAAMVRDVAQLLMSDEATAEATVRAMLGDPAQTELLWNGRRALETAIDRMQKVIKSEVRARGEVPVGEDRQLVIEVQVAEEIDPLKGWPAIKAAVGAERLPECVKIVKGNVEGIVREGAAKGQKKAAVEALMNTLRDAGAVTPSPKDTLQCRKRK